MRTRHARAFLPALFSCFVAGALHTGAGATDFVVDEREDGLIAVFRAPGTYRFLVDSSLSLAIIIHRRIRADKVVNMVLTDPLGKRFDLSSPPLDSTVHVGSWTVLPAPRGPYPSNELSVLIDTPAPGSWALEMNSNDDIVVVRVRGSTYTVGVPKLKPDQSGRRGVPLEAGEPLWAAVQLLRDGKPVLGVTIVGTLASFDSKIPRSEAPLAFHDDGIQGDQAANDGIYTAQVTGMETEEGFYWASARATDGRTLERLVRFPLRYQTQESVLRER